jgi:hypothetical protein
MTAPAIAISKKSQILPANKLRSLSQAELLSLLKKEHALGLFFNNEWEATVIEQTQFEVMKTAMEEMAEQLVQYENLIEDMQIHEQIQSRMDTPREKRLQKPEGMSTFEWVRSIKAKAQVEE